MNKKKYLTIVKKKPKATKGSIKASIVKSDLITFILLCDMPGRRMKSYGSTSLIEVFGKKLIDLQIEAIKSRFKNYELVLCAGFDAENVYKHIKHTYKKENIRLIENQLFNNTNSCESLRLCLNNIRNNKIFVMDGNLVFRNPIFDNMKLDRNFLVLEKSHKENLEVGVNINEHDLVEHMSFGATLTWSEIMFISEEKTIECMKNLLSNIDYKNKFIFELMNDVINLKHNITYIENSHPVQKINNIKTYKDIRGYT